MKTLRIHLLFLMAAMCLSCDRSVEEPIDRKALIIRHQPVNTTADSLGTLSVGNGDFAFSVDLTGLQSFPESYLQGIPLGTYSNWCWHSDPNTEGYHSDQTLRYYEVGGRDVPYIHDPSREGDSEAARAAAYLRENPHRMHMGMLGLKIKKASGEECSISDISNARQELNLWEGVIISTFDIDGVPVRVETLCHPEEAQIACRIHSPLLGQGRLQLSLAFPEADRGWKNSQIWGEDGRHRSSLLEQTDEHALIHRRQDSTAYLSLLQYNRAKLQQTGEHRFRLSAMPGDTVFSFSCVFYEEGGQKQSCAGYDETRRLAAQDWERYWTEGGAVDFSHCKDPRATELERRVVLSQYLMRVNCSGKLPPQETGLTFNSWFGKMHLEMHWWHSVHFALWQHPEILAEQMQFYKDIAEEARNLARQQGYAGLRWPKMIGPDGRPCPSNVANYLIWQQPHYIYFAELLYHFGGDPEYALDSYGKLVEETAEFMASYPVYDSIEDRYVLGPALIPAQETFHAESTINPAFELSYWYWALGIAMEWNMRQGLEVPPHWKELRRKLSGLPVQDSAYLFTEDALDSYTNEEYISDHPAVLGSLGMLPPTDKVDILLMQNTFNRIVERWNWPRTWGWDYPLVAMTAAELGLGAEAIHFLLLDVQKNTYLANGHNYQDGRLTLYLPGNGALLTAVARMCTKEQFPKDGNWDVRWEGLNDF